MVGANPTPASSHLKWAPFRVPHFPVNVPNTSFSWGYGLCPPTKFMLKPHPQSDCPWRWGFKGGFKLMEPEGGALMQWGRCPSKRRGHQGCPCTEGCPWGHREKAATCPLPREKSLGTSPATPPPNLGLQPPESAEIRVYRVSSPPACCVLWWQWADWGTRDVCGIYVCI